MLRIFRWAVCTCTLVTFSLTACTPPTKMQSTTTSSVVSQTATPPQEYRTSTPVVQRPTATVTATINEATQMFNLIFERTSTPTPSVARTLALEKLRSIIGTNLGCDFPCWAGLTPGVSKPLDAYFLLSSMSIISDYNLLEKTGGSIRYSFPVGELHNKIAVDFFTNNQNNTLEVISVQAYGIYGEYFPQVYDAQAFHDLFINYSIKSILNQYGKPSKITYSAYIVSEGDNFNPNPSRLTILYPDKGIFIQYDGPADVTGDIVRTCLNNVSIEVWFLSPADQNRYKEVLESFEISWPGMGLDGDLQEVSGMSIDAFYEKFSSSNNQCIETHVSIWPGP